MIGYRLGGQGNSRPHLVTPGIGIVEPKTEVKVPVGRLPALAQASLVGKTRADRGRLDGSIDKAIRSIKAMPKKLFSH